ncbi:carbohydrate ABC transporter permease [Aestuariimicrobium ganziense]|uniref:carbohydrate ABC transporter permease n=1 Tax=Aestuariimicrobium ganziense TaxID=2773677 RepID=UPI001944F98F|nr:carbohydrate ABC transporter permease [Aestuariimicrobium ganziense]
MANETNTPDIEDVTRTHVPGDPADDSIQQVRSSTPDHAVKDVSQRRRRRISRTILWVILAAISAAMVLPFLWMFFTAVRSQDELGQPNPPFFPRSWHFENFGRAIDAAPFHIYARNSFIIGIVNVFTTLLFGASAGYALAKLRFKAAPWIFGWFLATMMIPFYATVIPSFLLVRFMPLFGGNDIFGQGGQGWIDSWWALLVPGMVGAFSIFLLRQFYVTTPTELIEAARIDGLSEPRIWLEIMTPLVKPGLLTVGLLSFEGGWNNFLWPLLVTRDESLRVIQVGLSVFRQESNTQWDLLMAGTTLSALPMIVLFIIFQRYFVNGFVNSGIK